MRLHVPTTLVLPVVLVAVLPFCGCQVPTAGPWGDPFAARAWGIVGTPGFSGGSYTTSIGSEPGGNMFAAIQQYDGGVGDARVMWSPGGTGGWMDLGTLNTGPANALTLAVDQGANPYIAYVDSSGSAVVLKYGSGWAPLGSLPATSVTPSGFGPLALAIDSSDNVYLAYADASAAVHGSATVLMWNGSTWTQKGAAGEGSVSVAVDFLSLGVAASGCIFVAYLDAGSGNQGSATMWDPTTALWSQLGPRGFTGTSVWDVSLAVDPHGIPYVAYRGGSQSQANVMRLVGTAWEHAGNADFTSKAASGIRIVIDKWGTPYVGYSDEERGYKASAMVLRGDTWTPVGTPGFSPGPIAYPSMAINANGIPAFAFEDQANGNATTVMTFR